MNREVPKRMGQVQALVRPRVNQVHPVAQREVAPVQVPEDRIIQQMCRGGLGLEEVLVAGPHRWQAIDRDPVSHARPERRASLHPAARLEWVKVIAPNLRVVADETIGPRQVGFVEGLLEVGRREAVVVTLHRRADRLRWRKRGLAQQRPWVAEGGGRARLRRHIGPEPQDEGGVRIHLIIEPRAPNRYAADRPGGAAQEIIADDLRGRGQNIQPIVEVSGSSFLFARTTGSQSGLGGPFFSRKAISRLICAGENSSFQFPALPELSTVPNTASSRKWL